MRRRLTMTAVLLLAAALVLGACTGGGGQGGGDGEVIRVGMVYDVGGRGDQSFNDMAYAGLEQAQDEFGDQLEAEDVEPDEGGSNREELVRLYAERGYDLVIGVGFLFTDAMTTVSEEFPETDFAMVDGFVEGVGEDDNLALLLFRQNQGSFLVGAAAAMKTETGTVGFIGGQESALIEEFRTGYFAGVKHTNPDVEILSQYIGTTGEAFQNPSAGKEIALSQYDNGADIIYHAAGASGTGLFDAAVEQDQLAIGVDADQSMTVQSDEQREVILTSMMKRVDVAVYETIAAEVNGEFVGGPQTFGLANDGVGYAVNEYNEDMISDIEGDLEDLDQQIIDGEIQVPATQDDLDSFMESLGQ